MFSNNFASSLAKGFSSAPLLTNPRVQKPLASEDDNFAKFRFFITDPLGSMEQRSVNSIVYTNKIGVYIPVSGVC